MLFSSSAFAAKIAAGVCSAKARQLKNCRLKFGPTGIQITSDKILFNDKVWRWVHDLPLKGDFADWEKIEARSVGKDRLLQLWIWGEPQGEAQVQDLHWFVLSFAPNRVEQKVDQVVRRRRLNMEKSNDAKTKYIYDPEEKHGLKPSSTQVYWFVRDRRGRL